MGGSSKWMARINDQLVSAGDKVDGVSVREITSTLVTLEWHGEARNYRVGSRR